MPNLKSLKSKPFLGSALMHAMAGDPDFTPQESYYRRNLARLIDKAIREYQAARDSIITQIENDKNRSKDLTIDLPFLRFSDHFETCVNAMVRCLRLFEQLKNKKDPSIIVPRILIRKLNAFSSGIVNVRNTLEHIEESISTCEVGKGLPIFLVVGETEDCAVIGSHQLQFEDVANSLKALHSITAIFFQTKRQ